MKVLAVLLAGLAFSLLLAVGIGTYLRAHDELRPRDDR